MPFAGSAWSKSNARATRKREIDLVETHGHPLVVAARARGTLSVTQAAVLVAAGVRAGSASSARATTGNAQRAPFRAATRRSRRPTTPTAARRSAAGFERRLCAALPRRRVA
jgi:hypothetical protein